MKKFIFILVFFYFLMCNLYAKDLFLNKLVENNYIDTAISYCKENINNKDIFKDCISLLKKYGKYKELAEILNKKKEENPDNFILLYECYIKLNKFEDADKVFNKINNFILTKSQELKLENINTLRKALYYYKNYNYSNALNYFSKLKNLSLDDEKKKIKCLIFLNRIKEANLEIKKYKIKDFFINGLIEYKKGNYNQALLFFRKSENKNAKLYIYNCLVLTGKLNDALNYIVKKNKEEKRFFQKIKLLIDYGKYNEAITHLNSFKDNFEKFFYLGFINLKLRNYNKSIRYFLKAKEFYNTTKLNFYIGLAYYNNKSFINAIKYFKESFKIQDNYDFYIKSIYYLGVSYFEIGDYENALKYFFSFLNYPNKNVPVYEIYYKIAESYEKLGDFDNAILYFNKFYEVTKDRKVLIKIAKIAEKKGDFAYSVQILSNFLPVKNKKNSFILKQIAEIYFNNGNYKESIKFYRKYLNFNKSEFSEIYLKIGLCYLYSDDIKNAKITFLKLVESQKKSKFRDEALYWLGLIYYREKDYTKASIYFQRLYNANSSSYLTNQAIKYILICSIKQRDKKTFKKFISLYNSPEDILNLAKDDLKNFCNTKSCLSLLTLKTKDEVNYEIFNKLNDLIANNRVNELKKYVQKYIDYFQYNPLIYYKIGKFLKEHKYNKEAIFYFNHFLNLTKTKENYLEVKYALTFLLKYYFKNKNYQKIINYVEKFNYILLPNEANYIVGISYYKLKFKEKCKNYLFNYINNFNIKEDNLKYLYDSAFKLDDLDFTEEALKGYQKFLNFSKDKNLNVEVLYWIGDIYYRQGMYKKSLETFLKIKLLYKEYSKWSIQASFRAGNIFEKFGKIDKALKEYKYIYYMLPDNDPRKIYIKKKLESIKNEKNR